MVAAPENLAVGLADAQALKARAASGDREALRAAAKQFESLLLAQMLKAMRETRFSDEDDPMNGGESLKLYRELLDQQWAAKLSNGKGIGFADMLVKHLERQAGFPAETDKAARGPSGAGSAPADKLQDPIPDANPVVAGAPGSSPASPASASSSPGAPRASDRKQQFLDSLRPHAEAAEAATGVPARFILAQAALESGWGEREIRGPDGQASFNLFGVKAGRNWTGGTVESLTTEYRQGVAMKLSQRFRSYDDYASAFTDFANLLKTRYSSASASGADALAYARGLAAGGYATDPDYADKLQAVIATVSKHAAMAGV
jgi:flagellar protein FlgJ